MYTEIREPSRRLAQPIVKVLRYSSIISFAVEAVIILVFYILSRYFGWGVWSQWVLWAGMILVTISAVWSIGLRPYFIYRNTRYDITEDFLQIKTGAFHEEHELVPMTKIQAVSTHQGPLLRRFGLYTVVVETMGSGHSVQGLPKETALELRNQIAWFAKIREVDEE